mmetsp:Transcript_19265/g.58167  ORF Transcript_19265/g.58167 Transcript_19265/m.58167 type:complete len:398 (-) Transcript_19265:313-1506(-)
MSRALLGAAAGAGGAGIYFTGVGESLRYVLDQGMGFSRGSGGGSVSDQQYQELLRMVQNMSTEMSRRQQGITILHTNETRSGMVYYVAVAATGGMVYLRYFRGWRFADMMYVTRGSLKASIGHLSDGLGALGDRLTSVKTYLQSQIRTLTTKQDQTMAAQAAMQEHLNVVGRDVEETRYEVSEMHGAVRELEANMDQLSVSQQYANHGIYVLCKVVGDLIKGPSGSGSMRKSAEELEQFVRHPPTLHGTPVQGLEALLGQSPTEEPVQRASSGPAPPLGRSHMASGHMARAATESALSYGYPQSSHSGGNGSGMGRTPSTSGSATIKARHGFYPTTPVDDPETPRSGSDEARPSRQSSTTGSLHSGRYQAKPAPPLSRPSLWDSPQSLRTRTSSSHY